MAHGLNRDKPYKAHRKCPLVANKYKTNFRWVLFNGMSVKLAAPGTLRRFPVKVYAIPSSALRAHLMPLHGLALIARFASKEDFSDLNGELGVGR